jgi:type IV pilus assembly protein PilW
MSLRQGLHYPAKPVKILRGFSLIELMISITIGLLLVAALLALYLNITRNNNELANANSQIENGRFAIQLVQSDLVHAGYWGGFVPQFDDLTTSSLTYTNDSPILVPDPCLGYSTLTPWAPAYKTNLLGTPVAVYASGSVPSTCTKVTGVLGNSDVLVVRHANTCISGAANCDGGTDTGPQIQVSNCSSDAATYVIDSTTFPLKMKDCATANPDHRKIVSNIYFLTTSNGLPTLVRVSLVNGAYQNAQPLIEGIEAFHVELGIDSVSSKSGAGMENYIQSVQWVDNTTKVTPLNRGDGVPDGAFVSCGTGCTASQLMNVTAVKLYVLARASTTTPGYTDAKTYTLGSTTLGPFNDGFKRHVFSTTIRLINVSGRRDTP